MKCDLQLLFPFSMELVHLFKKQNKHRSLLALPGHLCLAGLYFISFAMKFLSLVLKKIAHQTVCVPVLLSFWL